jgi:hypothetical protein
VKGARLSKDATSRDAFGSDLARCTCLSTSDVSRTEVLPNKPLQPTSGGQIEVE